MLEPAHSASLSFPPVEAAGPDWAAVIARIVAEPSLLRAHFQPVVDLRRGSVVGYEALGRFPSELVGGAVPTGTWLAAARQLGLAGPVEAALIRTALAARPLVVSDRFMSINVSPTGLVTADVRAALFDQARLDSIVIELTDPGDEGANPLSVREVLDTVRTRGGKVAIDDAGARFGSLHRITVVRPDFVKIDGSVVAEVDRDPSRARMVATLAEFAGRIGALLIAEGIERTEQIETLVGLGVQFGQGFVLGAPTPAMADIDHELATWLRRPAASVPVVVTGLAELVQRAPHAESPVGREMAADLLARDPQAAALVVVDHRGHPLALIDRLAFLRGETPTQNPLSLPLATPPADAARRAMARPQPERFQPVVCLDELGRSAGIVTIEALVDRLSR